MVACRRAAVVAAVVATLAACGGDDGGGGGSSPPPASAGVRLTPAAGDRQAGVAGTTLPVPIVVRATDSLGAPVSGLTIRWRTTEGTGTPDPATSLTDADGRAGTAWRAGTAPGAAVLTAEPVDAEDAALGAALAFSLTVVPEAPAALVATIPIPPDYGIHDTFVRDGLAFVSAWSTGLLIYDVGHGIRGGSPSRPVEVSRHLPPAGPSGLQGNVHNAWWFHNPVTGEKRYVFVGQEGPGSVGAGSSGDLYAVDVSDLARPRTVATYRLAGAGSHNVWMDEAAQVLYVAYYNGGVVALDVSGALSGDLAARERSRVQPGGVASTYVWGVQLHRGAVYAIDMESGLWKLSPSGLATQGGGFNVPDRWSSDLWLHGDYAYTGTWGGIPRNGNNGDQLKVWDVRGAAPAPVGVVDFPGVGTLSDVEASADGRLLLVTTERGTSQGLHLLSLATPSQPAPVAFAEVDRGLHTGTFAEIGGRRFVFAAKNPTAPALLVYDVTAAAP
jgi:hypothetical protein